MHMRSNMKNAELAPGILFHRHTPRSERSFCCLVASLRLLPADAPPPSISLALMRSHFVLNCFLTPFPPSHILSLSFPSRCSSLRRDPATAAHRQQRSRRALPLPPPVRELCSIHHLPVLICYTNAAPILLSILQFRTRAFSLAKRAPLVQTDVGQSSAAFTKQTVNLERHCVLC
jgi:hypothetical protein